MTAIDFLAILIFRGSGGPTNGITSDVTACLLGYEVPHGDLRHLVDLPLLDYWSTTEVEEFPLRRSSMARSSSDCHDDTSRLRQLRNPVHLGQSEAPICGTVLQPARGRGMVPLLVVCGWAHCAFRTYREGDVQKRSDKICWRSDVRYRYACRHDGTVLHLRDLFVNIDSLMLVSGLRATHFFL